MEILNIEDIKKIELNMLKDIHDFCITNNIEYCLAGGTLLGAVRHSGFIPWDDDIDIFMPRESYEVFIKRYQGNTGQYKVIDVSNTRGYPYAFAKVICSDTCIDEYRFKPYAGGVYIDVFPLDRVGSDMNSIIRLNRKIHILRKWLIIKMARLSYYYGIKKIALIFGKIVTLLIPGKYIINKIDTLAQSLATNDSKYCACMTMLTYGIREVFECKWFESYVNLPFETAECLAPISYKEVLTGMYKDYMKLPPEEKRITHHSFTAWMKEELK